MGAPRRLAAASLSQQEEAVPVPAPALAALPDVGLPLGQELAKVPCYRFALPIGLGEILLAPEVF